MQISKRLAGASAAGLIGVGALGLVFPQPLARGFGIPAQDRDAIAFVRATSVRDVAIGAILLAAVLRGNRQMLSASLIAGVGISAADFLNARRPVHLAGGALFAIILGLSRNGL
jgi:hypothetical protein